MAIREDCTPAFLDQQDRQLSDAENGVGNLSGGEVGAMGRAINALRVDCDRWPYVGPEPDYSNSDPSLNAPVPGPGNP